MVARARGTIGGAARYAAQVRLSRPRVLVALRRANATHVHDTRAIVAIAWNSQRLSEAEDLMVALWRSRSMRRHVRTYVRALRSSLLSAVVITSGLSGVACRSGDPAVDSTSAQYGIPRARDSTRASQASLGSPFSRLAAAIRGPAASDTPSHR